VANEILIKNGTPVVWADSTDYNPAGSGYTRTHQIDVTDLADAAARQGAKADLGATRAARYSVFIGVEIAVAPTAGEVVDVFWSASFSATAGTGNDGGTTGADAAYKGGEEAEWARQLTYIGSLVVTADADPTVQRTCLSSDFRPPNRYGMPIILNESVQALHSDAVEAYIALVPLIDEVQ